MAIKQMTLMQRVSSGNKKFEVSGDIIVPDIKPDIVSITTSNANTYIYKEEISTGKIRVDGNIDAYIIYISDSGETRSIQTTLDFVETINDEKAEENKFDLANEYMTLYRTVFLMDEDSPGNKLTGGSTKENSVPKTPLLNDYKNLVQDQGKRERVLDMSGDLGWAETERD